MGTDLPPWVLFTSKADATLTLNHLFGITAKVRRPHEKIYDGRHHSKYRRSDDGSRRQA
jgi:hypothetical protein